MPFEAVNVRSKSQYTSGSKARRQRCAGVLSLLAQMWGKRVRRTGLCEFVGRFRVWFAQRVSRLCAASRSRTSMFGWRTRESELPKSRQRHTGGKNGGWRQEAVSHSAQRLREECGDCSICRRYREATDASRMSRTRVRWLATKSASRTVAWQEAKPWTGIRLRPNRSRTLLRLSAELRRP